MVKKFRIEEGQCVLYILIMYFFNSTFNFPSIPDSINRSFLSYGQPLNTDCIYIVSR